MSIDHLYQGLVAAVLHDGKKVVTRGNSVRMIHSEVLTFDSTPLISVRKTAWKSCLLEWEWFMKGSCDIRDLHPSVRHWWEPFCKIDRHTLPYAYGKSLRKSYSVSHGDVVDVPIKKMLPEDDVLKVPHFDKLEVEGEGTHLGFRGRNNDGDDFTVVRRVKGDRYLVQFDSNGFCVECNAGNFTKMIVKNPYYLSVLGCGCVGLIDKERCTYYKKGYSLWQGMMRRCYDSTRRNYRWYGARGVRVCGRWRNFEYFLSDLCCVPGFEEWLLQEDGSFHLDKDYNKADYYGPDVCVFLPRDMNVALAQAERFYEVPRKKLYVDQVQCLLDGVRNHPSSRRNCITSWNPGHVASGLMSPTNCHSSIIQTFVSPDNVLDLTTYQRSVDLICGFPHNILQMYGFLLWLAYHGKRKVGTLTWIGGDIHLYDQHEELANKIINTSLPENYVTPSLVYSPPDNSNEDFKADHFHLDGDYRPILTDRAEMVI